MTPAILAYAAAKIRVRTATATAVIDPSSPNPASSTGALGPIETLVYLDPTWAGTAKVWIAAGIALLIALAAAAAVFMPREPTGRAMLDLRLASFVAGILLAWPWISVLIRT